MARADIPESVAAELDAFVAERLVITDRLETSTYLSVAHEAFLSSWPPLARAITAKAVGLRARGTVEDAAREWDKSGRPATRLLWDGDRLAAALSDTGARMRLAPRVIGAPGTGRLPRWVRRRHLVTERVDVNPMARDFLERSFRRDRFRRRRLIPVEKLFTASQGRSARSCDDLPGDLGQRRGWNAGRLGSAWLLSGAGSCGVV